LDESDIVVLKRVYRNCDQIKEILKREPIAKAISSSAPIDRDASRTVTLSLTSDELLIVRKVWELGVETVEMQTVAQLDGDIVTRIRRARVASTNATLHLLHREAVESALGHWQSLFQTVVQFAATLADGVFSRRT
jgi:hypothetical protein